jgi:hypothetical protein
MKLPPRTSLVIGILLSFFAGCGKPDLPASSVTVRDSAGVRITETAWTGSEVFRVLKQEPTTVIGQADGSPEYTIGRVGGGLLLPGDRVAVGDGFALEVKVFDGAGVHLFSFGGPGSGPGEFGVLWTLNRYPGDSIIVGESGAHRLSVFDSEGNFGRLIRPEVTSVGSEAVFTMKSCCDFAGALAGGDLLITFPEEIPSSGPETRWAELPLWVTDPEGGSPRFLGVFRGGEFRRAGGLSPRPSIGLQMNTSAIVLPHPNGFVELDGVEHSVRSFSAEGVLSSIGRIDRPREEMTAENRAAFEEYYEELVAASGYSPEETGLSERINQPYPDSLPAFNVALADPSGNVWAGRYWRHPLDITGGFDVFSPTGAYLGKVVLPNRMRVLDVGTDRLLALVLDQSDVPYLHVYELQAPQPDG